jgi:hypothetical protein
MYAAAHGGPRLTQITALNDEMEEHENIARKKSMKSLVEDGHGDNSAPLSSASGACYLCL